MWAHRFDLTTRVFAPAQFHNGSLIEDFCFASGVPFDHEVASAPKRNPSLSIDKMNLVIELNKLLMPTRDPNVEKRRRDIITLLDEVEIGDPFSLPQAIKSDVWERFFASNRRVEKMFLRDQHIPDSA